MSSPDANRRRPLPPRKAQAQAAARRSGAVTASRIEPRLLERAVVREVPCPRCGAQAGDPCTARRGERRSHHLERVRARTAAAPL